MPGSPGMVAVGGGTEEVPDRAQIGFAGRRARDRVDNGDVGGNLVAGQALPQMLDQLVGGCGLRNSTMATGVSPSRSSERPITAAPATAG